METSEESTEPPVLIMYTYIMHFVCLCVYVLVVKTLWLRKSRDTVAQTYYLLSTHTCLMIVETVLVYGEFSTLLPHLAIKINGVFAAWGVKPIILVETGLFALQTMTISIVMCLIFRFYLIKRRRFGRHYAPEKHVHLIQVFFYLFSVPFYILFHWSEVEKNDIPQEVPSTFIGTRPFSLRLLTGGARRRGCSGLEPILSITLSRGQFSGSITVDYVKIKVRIFYGLSKNHQHSQLTKELHKRAVYSSMFMALPIYATCTTVAFIWMSVYVLNLFGLALDFDGINSFFTPLILGNSLLVSANTLYTAYRSQILEFLGRPTGFEHRRMTAEFSMDQLS
ncbi:unnamed protein product, partial [Mesorhabditis belari]|uniref:Uncharacterized protein n=1 Tax=Mesorhabditis belari TaxID=2138241 RepID=A0AAF3EK53_9BILA